MKMVPFPQANSAAVKLSGEARRVSRGMVLTEGCEGKFRWTTCFKMGWRERLSGLLFGKVWFRLVLEMETEGERLPDQKMTFMAACAKNRPQ